MKICAQAGPLLDDYVDGELTADDTAAVQAHIESCAACRQTEAELRALRARTAELPDAIEPPRDLWKSIAQRIEEGAGPSNVVEAPFNRPAARRSSWRRVLPIAAALLVTVAGLSIYYTMHHARSGAAYLAAESEYVSARAELLAAIDERKDSLTPETLVAVEENLRVIDQAVSEIRAAMATDPQDPRLADMLMATREKEMDFLQQVVRIP
ncbi:MAG: hypothetical protein GWP08_01565 [Nitrospiraceae bacterium]|nr:hypothetical protein [Nitrospiraceae bacterium]